MAREGGAGREELVAEVCRLMEDNLDTWKIRRDIQARRLPPPPLQAPRSRPRPASRETGAAAAQRRRQRRSAWVYHRRGGRGSKYTFRRCAGGDIQVWHRPRGAAADREDHHGAASPLLLPSYPPSPGPLPFRLHRRSHNMPTHVRPLTPCPALLPIPRRPRAWPPASPTAPSRWASAWRRKAGRPSRSHRGSRPPRRGPRWTASQRPL